jgi:hypothetical protein
MPGLARNAAVAAQPTSQTPGATVTTNAPVLPKLRYGDVIDSS